MKHFLARIARFFWSWGFLKFCFVVVTLVILLYVEEDWRGARAWAATKAKWEARGESFDRNKLIPPPVPENRNLAALPLFKESQDPNDKRPSLIDVALKKALRRDDHPGLSLSYNWEKGGAPDVAKFRADIATQYTTAFGKSPANLDTLAQFNELYPFAGELTAATATRPDFRLSLAYDMQPIYGLSLGLLTDEVGLARILTYHALLALDQQQPDTALADIRTIWQIQQGISREPMLVAGLVANALTSLSLGVVYRGLDMHAWSDAQLHEIETQLRRIDALTGYQIAMRGEFLMFSIPTLTYLKTHPQIANLMGTESNPPPFYDTNPIFNAWPEGWIDLNAARVTDTLLSSLALTDPKTHRTFAGVAEKMRSDADAFAGTWVALAPWNIFSAISMGPVLNAALQFARAQVRVDEARIACGLERYRLARGAYPASLDELVPVFMSAVPPDVIDGQPYRYRLQPGGNYLLYSIGWNEKDDGGQAVFSLPPGTDEHDSPNKHGDWVWPVPR